MKLITFLLLLSFSFSLLAQRTIDEQLRSLEVQLLEQEFTNGGIRIKKEFLDITIKSLRKKYYGLIKNAMTLEEYNGYAPKVQRDVLTKEQFQQLMVGLASEFRDGHHNTMRLSGDHWSLGLHTAVIQGKLYITGINELIYSPGNFSLPVAYGDEIISINGKSMEKIRKEFGLYTGMFSGTDVGRTIMALESSVSRSGRYLMSVKEGESVALELKRGDKIFKGVLNWVDVSKISRDIDFYSGIRPDAPKAKTPKEYRFGMMSQKQSQFRMGVDNLGLKNGAITDVGVLINNHMTKELQKLPSNIRGRVAVGPVTRLDAYTVNLGNARAGVIRIPSYSPNGFSEVMKEINWIAEAVERMNNMGVHFFVVDANSNGGGYVTYVSHLMRFFAKNGDIKTGSASIRLTEHYLADLKNAINEGVSLDFANDFGDAGIKEMKNIVSLDSLEPEIRGQVQLKDYFNVLKDSFADQNLLRIQYEEFKKSFDQGVEFTGQLPYMGTRNGISKNEQGRVARDGVPVFNAPVIFLADKRACSGGCYGPGILASKINQAALGHNVVVVGDTTRGLGMPVYRSQSALPGSGMYTRNPYAFSRLPDGLVLENIGAVPQVRREVFYQDLMSNFTYYAMDVFNVGALLTQKKTIKELSTYVNKSVTKLLSGGEPLPELVSDIIKMSLEVKGQTREIAKTKAQKEALAKKYQSLYKKFNEYLKLVKAENLEAYGVFLNIALPEFLISEDMILASVYRSQPVISRLEDLLKHSNFSRRPETKKLIKTLINTYSILDNAASTNDCNTLFKALASVKTE